MDKLIPSFSVENAISFFKKNIRSFKTESEDFSHILKSDDLEKFSLVKKIGIQYYPEGTRSKLAHPKPDSEIKKTDRKSVV